MTSRWFNAGVLVFWLVAMSWLLTQKVLPPLLTGDPPDYDAALPVGKLEAEPSPVVCWHIEWDGRVIGTAASRAVPTQDGAELRSVVRFSRLPVRNMLGQLMGVMAKLLDSTLGGDEFTPNLAVATRMQFNAQRRLTGFETIVELPELPQFLQIKGDVTSSGKLKLLATARYPTGMAGSPPAEVNYRHELELPPDALVGDSLSPRAQLKNLHVGQQWTIPNYRPFPPNSPVQILLARVEKSEFIEHGGELVEVFVVVYHDEAGSGLGSTRAPIGRTWVEPGGDVLRQEVMLSNLRLRFERLAADDRRDAVAWLDDEPFERYFAGLNDEADSKPVPGP